MKYSKQDQNSGIFGRSTDSEIANGTGCTACCAFITKTQIICGNAGDSRAVVGEKENGRI